MHTKEIISSLKKPHKPLEIQFSMNKEATVVMITGGNGFLASNLIKDLEQLDEVKVIYALVRNATKYTNSGKVEYVDYKGVSSFYENELDEKLKKVTCFIHCAAEVNNFKKFEAMYSTNVEFTFAILQKIQAMKLNLAFHYVSTLSVFASSNINIEQYELPPEQRNTSFVKDIVPISSNYSLFGGYAQTKWASEYLLSETNANIFRLGLVTPSLEQPYFNPEEFITRFLYLIIKYPFTPFKNEVDCKRFTEGTSVDLSPVNFVSKTMSQVISRKYRFLSDENEDFTHIANHKSTSLWNIINRFNDVMPNKIQHIGKEKWEEKIKELKSMDTTLLRFAFFREELLKTSEVKFNCDLFQTSLFNWGYKNKAVDMPSGTDIIEVYLKAMLALRNKPNE